MTEAVRDGFIESGGCQHVENEGTRGFPYVHAGRSRDGIPAVEAPTALLYAKELGPGRRLMALEYQTAVTDPEQVPPELFGQPFSQEGDRWVLRVWLYADNPDGLFAPANPGEACDADELVGWHLKSEGGCQEVSGAFPVDAQRLRARVSDRFELVTSPKDPTGETAWLEIGGNHCAAGTLRDEHTEQLTTLDEFLFGHYDALVQPHDWVGVDPLLNRYLLNLVFDDPEVARAAQTGMGVTPDVMGYSPDLARDFTPVAAGIDPAYRFRAPEFTLEAVVLDPGSDSSGPASPRFWHESSRGLAKLQAWVANSRPAPAMVTVTPTAGTPLADLLGCHTDPCESVVADRGLTVSWTHHRTRVTAQ